MNPSGFKQLRESLRLAHGLASKWDVPILKTIAASGVHGISKMLEYHRTNAPLRKNTEQEEVGDAALFLVSRLSRGITGEVLHVDGGYHVMGMAADVV